MFYKVISSIVMGIGISGMHYTGMLAASFHEDMGPPGSHMEVQTFHWSIFVTLIVFCIQTLLLFSSHADRKFIKQSERIKDNEQRFQSLIVHNIDAIFILSLDGDIISSNHAGEDMIRKFGFSMHDWRHYTSKKINRLLIKSKRKTGH